MLVRLGCGALLLSSAALLSGQSAQLSGLVRDPAGAVLANASLELRNRDTGVRRQTLTNQEGFYSFPSLKPGTYQATLQVPNFRTLTREAIALDVGDRASLDFTLQLAHAGEQITVTGDDALVNPLDPAVSTVVDQGFVKNMPLNGRSFQSLIALTPGVVFTSSDIGMGQFSVNGQRSNANYFTVDGVSASFGISTTFYLDQSLGGAIPGLTSDGGTNGLVSVDAMEEFRIQTSTYAPEFGRTPGASVSILTKSGTNQFHGNAFDYWRNDIFDARNFFNMVPQPKPPLRQNDFGGTLGGPLVRNRTFFFASYEGLRVRLPRTDSALFYTASARAAVAPAYQPFINALPLPTAAPIDPKCDNITIPCQAPFTVAYSNPSSLDATSIRVDHSLGRRVSLFARYNHAPSQSGTRSFSQLTERSANTDTLTVAATVLISSTTVNDFRANWSRVRAGYVNSIINAYDAVAPPASVLFPSPFSPDATQAFVFFPDGGSQVVMGPSNSNSMAQLNFVNTLGWTAATHQVKFGMDYRSLNPDTGQGNGWSVFPSSYTSLVAGTADVLSVRAHDAYSVRMNNYSLFAQDTWRVTNHLTLTYGLRWEINTPPVSAIPGKPLHAVQGIFDSSPLAVTPGSLWHTRYDNLAPRFGAAYQASTRIVIRGGTGVFYDLGYGNVGSASGAFPYVRSSFILDPTLPFSLTSAAFRIPPFSTRIEGNVFSVPAVDPNLRLPFTIHWNAAIELGVGTKQTLTGTYVGANGRRLLRQVLIRPPEFVALVSIGTILATQNGGHSHYHALQLQFQRRMSRGVQAIAAYSLAKSSDIGSHDGVSDEVVAASVSQIAPLRLTPSDFDIRHSLSAAVSYEMPTSAGGAFRNAILNGWVLDGLLRASSPPPINVTIGMVSPAVGRIVTQPDSVPGQPYWIADGSQPGGRILNGNAFARPIPGTVGNFTRNGLRSPFSIAQLDVALRRRFHLTDRVQLDVRAEYFNLLNHPMFGAPGNGNAPFTFLGYGDTVSPSFGKVLPGYTTNVAMGTQNPLHTVGGPRSGQLTLKLHF